MTINDFANSVRPVAGLEISQIEGASSAGQTVDAVLAEINALATEWREASVWNDPKWKPQAVHERRNELHAAALSERIESIAEHAADAADAASTALDSLQPFVFDPSSVPTADATASWSENIRPALEASGPVVDWVGVVRHAGPDELAALHRFAGAWVRRNVPAGVDPSQRQSHAAGVIADIEDATYRRGIELHPDGPAALRAAEAALATERATGQVLARLRSGRVRTPQQLAEMTLTLKSTRLTV